jgi:hypothetical protein
MSNIVLVDNTVSDKFIALYPGLMARDSLRGEYHKQSYLMNELESLGLREIRLNEFNDARELGGLVTMIKEDLLKEYRNSYQVAAR